MANVPHLCVEDRTFIGQSTKLFPKHASYQPAQILTLALPEQFLPEGVQTTQEHNAQFCSNSNETHIGLTEEQLLAVQMRLSDLCPIGFPSSPRDNQGLQPAPFGHTL